MLCLCDPSLLTEHSSLNICFYSFVMCCNLSGCVWSGVYSGVFAVSPRAAVTHCGCSCVTAVPSRDSSSCKLHQPLWQKYHNHRRKWAKAVIEVPPMFIISEKYEKWNQKAYSKQCLLTKKTRSFRDYELFNLIYIIYIIFETLSDLIWSFCYASTKRHALLVIQFLRRSNDNKLTSHSCLSLSNNCLRK